MYKEISSTLPPYRPPHPRRWPDDSFELRVVMDVANLFTVSRGDGDDEDGDVTSLMSLMSRAPQSDYLDYPR